MFSKPQNDDEEVFHFLIRGSFLRIVSNLDCINFSKIEEKVDNNEIGLQFSK